MSYVITTNSDNKDYILIAGKKMTDIKIFKSPRKADEHRIYLQPDYKEKLSVTKI